MATPMVKKGRSPVRSVFLALLFLVAYSSCTITSSYGPYVGRVVDMDTNEPIEGAVVLAHFYTEFITFVDGTKSDFVDAIETVTDRNGQFLIPIHRIWTFRVLSIWSDEADIDIFKSGYSYYPGGKGMSQSTYPIKPIRKALIKLVKLESKEERLKNGGYNLPDMVPRSRMPLFLRALNEDLASMGYPPRSTQDE